MNSYHSFRILENRKNSVNSVAIIVVILRKMPEDYKKVVLEEYRRKRNNGHLSTNLLNPTPGNVRNECLILSSQRNSPKDLEILRLFFRSGEPENGYMKRIQNSKADDYKQVAKILTMDIRNPGDRLIELIAWLIDFELRPSSTYYMSFYKAKTAPVVDMHFSEISTESRLDETVTASMEGDVTTEVFEGETKAVDDLALVNTSQAFEKDDIIKHGDVCISKQPEIIRTGGIWKNRTFRNVVLASIILFLTSGTAFVLKDVIFPQCMYWTGDHYESINCDETAAAAAIIPYNKKMAQLKRITRPDTLTMNAIGHVWYAKPKINSAEFYTDSGSYPLDQRKRLLPVTEYMLKKYIFSQKKPAQQP